MMLKNSAMNIPCAYCDKQSVPGTNPPVCEEHSELTKKASESSSNLKELDSYSEDTE